ncbi:MAG: hypothetical protein RMY64_20525 [Nostoc sp. DedQUE08]|nr:hypothetical protein [Nostoc sp. DedQUE08]MDZ8067980.1 hypothetical protein [Nostoc sp. DedQUE08]
MEELVLALLELRLRSWTWKGGYKVNQEGKSNVEKESDRSFSFVFSS